MPRLFYGVPAPQALDTEGIVEAVKAAGNVRAVDPSLYHVTLAFLGDTADSRVAAAKDALQAGCEGIAGGAGTVKGLGAFPNPGRARVVWLGIEGAPLDAIAAGVRGALSARQFRIDDKPFHAHITLARAKGSLDVRRLVEENTGTTFGPFPCDEVRLYASTLTPEGPRYETLASVALEEQA